MEWAQGEMTLKAMCSLLDLDEIMHEAGTVAGCATVCTKSKN